MCVFTWRFLDCVHQMAGICTRSVYEIQKWQYQLEVGIWLQPKGQQWYPAVCSGVTGQITKERDSRFL